MELSRQAGQFFKIILHFWPHQVPRDPGTSKNRLSRNEVTSSCQAQVPRRGSWGPGEVKWQFFKKKSMGLMRQFRRHPTCHMLLRFEKVWFWRSRGTLQRAQCNKVVADVRRAKIQNYALYLALYWRRFTYCHRGLGKWALHCPNWSFGHLFGQSHFCFMNFWAWPFILHLSSKWQFQMPLWWGMHFFWTDFIGSTGWDVDAMYADFLLSIVVQNFDKG